MWVLFETIICILLGAFIVGAIIGWFCCKWLDEAEVKMSKSEVDLERYSKLEQDWLNH